MNPRDFSRFFQGQYDSYEEDLPFWLGLAAHHGDPILELGCGAGRLLRYFQQMGYLVVGVDQDREMIQRAVRSIHDPQSNRVLIRANLRDLGLTPYFNLALMACNTFTGIDPEDALWTLQGIRAALRDRGILAVELPNPNPTTWEMDEDGELIDWFIEPESGNPIQVYCEQQTVYNPKQVGVSWRFDELSEDGLVRTYRIETLFNLWNVSDLKNVFQLAGFSKVSYYGDYSMIPFREDSPRLMVVAATDSK